MKAHRVCAVVGMLVVGVTGWGSAAAVATPPVSFPLPAVSIEFDDVPCGPILVDFSAGETQRVFFDAQGSPRFAVITGPFSATVTSMDTGKSVHVDIPGPAKFTRDAVILTGPSLIIGPKELWLTWGRVVLPGGDPDRAQVTGRIVDLCPQLQL